MTFGGHAVDMNCHCSAISESLRSRGATVEQTLHSHRRRNRRRQQQPEDEKTKKKKKKLAPMERDGTVAQRDKDTDVTENIAEDLTGKGEPTYQSDAPDYYHDYPEYDLDDADAYIISSPTSHDNIRYYLLGRNQFENDFRAVNDNLRPRIVYVGKSATLTKDSGKIVYKDATTKNFDLPNSKDKVGAKTSKNKSVNRVDDRPEENEDPSSQPNIGKMSSVFKYHESSGTDASSAHGESANAVINGERPSSANGAPGVGRRSGCSPDTPHLRVSGNEPVDGEEEKTEGRPYDGLNGKKRPQNRQQPCPALAIPPATQPQPTRPSKSLQTANRRRTTPNDAKPPPPFPFPSLQIYHLLSFSLLQKKNTRRSGRYCNAKAYTHHQNYRSLNVLYHSFAFYHPADVSLSTSSFFVRSLKSRLNLFLVHVGQPRRLRPASRRQTRQSVMSNLQHFDPSPLGPFLLSSLRVRGSWP